MKKIPGPVFFLVLFFCTTCFAPADEDPPSEAARFARESYFLSQNGRKSDALEKIEVAIALAPENLDYRKDLYDLLKDRFRRMISRENKGFAWDTKKSVLRFDKEGLREVVQLALQIESIVDSFPPEHELKKYRNRYLGHMRHDLTRLVEKLDIGFQEEVRALNLRVLAHWREKYFLPARDAVVDRETFRIYMRAVNGAQNTFSSQRIEDIIEPYEELVESMLRFSRNDWLDEGDPKDPNDTRYIHELYEGFARTAARYRLEYPKGSDEKLDASIERTVSRLERDDRLLPRIYVWIARNRYDFYGQEHHDETGRARAKEYFDKARAYLSGLPHDVPYADYTVMYNELFQTVPYIHRGYHSDAAIPLYAEILELAESREEYARGSVWELISRLKIFLAQTEKDRKNVLENLDRYKNLIRSQLDLAEERGITAQSRHDTVDEMRQKAVRAGLLPGKPKRIRPWKEETLLLPKEPDTAVSIVAPNRVPYIFEQKLYVPVYRKSLRLSTLAVVDLTPDESGGYPIEYLGKLPPGPVLQYVDAKNAYVWNRAGSEPMGLYVYPLDGSEPWRLTMEEELPSGNVHVYGGFDGRIFMNVGAAWVIRVDTETRDWKILSSSLAKTGETPFVDGRKPGFQVSCDDPKRNRILLFGRSGMYAIDRKTEKFVYLSVPNFGWLDFFTFTPEGNLWAGDRSTFTFVNLEGTYDAATEKSKAAPSADRSERPKICCATYAGAVHDGYLWGGLMVGNTDWAWARCSTTSEGGDSPLLEPLEIPEAIEGFQGFERSRWFPSYCAPLPDGKGLIVGTHDKLVLLRFE